MFQKYVFVHKELTHRKEHPNDFDLRLSASINTGDMDRHPTAWGESPYTNL